MSICSTNSMLICRAGGDHAAGDDSGGGGCLRAPRGSAFQASYRQEGLFHLKVAGFVPRTQCVNLRIVCQPGDGPWRIRASSISSARRSFPLLPLEPFPPEAGPSRTRTSQDAKSALKSCLVRARLVKVPFQDREIPTMAYKPITLSQVGSLVPALPGSKLKETRPSD